MINDVSRLKEIKEILLSNPIEYSPNEVVVTLDYTTWRWLTVEEILIVIVGRDSARYTLTKDNNLKQVTIKISLSKH